MPQVEQMFWSWEGKVYDSLQALGAAMLSDLLLNTLESRTGGPAAEAKTSRPTEKIKPFVTTTSGMSGYFAVILWWNPEMDGFWEPWDTGIGRYATKAEAIQEAKELAEMEGLEYRSAMP